MHMVTYALAAGSRSYQTGIGRVRGSVNASHLIRFRKFHAAARGQRLCASARRPLPRQAARASFRRRPHRGRADGTYDKLFDKFGMTKLKATTFAIKGDGPTN